MLLLRNALAILLLPVLLAVALFRFGTDLKRDTQLAHKRLDVINEPALIAFPDIHGDLHNLVRALELVQVWCCC